MCMYRRKISIGITTATVIALSLCLLIVYAYSFFVVKPAARVDYTISQNTIFVKTDGECYITFNVHNTGTVDFVIEAIVLDKDVIPLPVEGMGGSTKVEVGRVVALRIPLKEKYEVGTVVNLFLKTNPPLLEAQKFVVAPTPVAAVG